MREIYHDLGLEAAGVNFDRWVDATPQPRSARRAIARARKRGKGGR
jgi:hypothetical protein